MNLDENIFKIKFNLDRKEINTIKLNRNILTPKNKEVIILKKIKKKIKNYPKYLNIIIENNPINEINFEILVNNFNNQYFENNEEILDIFKSYFFIKRNFYKNYSLWFYLDLNYYRKYYLNEKEINFINYFYKKVSFIKKYNKSKELILNQGITVKNNFKRNEVFFDKLKYHNISVVYYHKILNFMRNMFNKTDYSSVKKYKINDVINQIINLKIINNNKIVKKFKKLTSNFNNNLNNSINEECNNIFNKNYMINKCYLFYTYNSLINQINSTVQNFTKINKKCSYNFNEKYMCIICLKTYIDKLNNIIYCDGCNYAIHTRCYGVSNKIEKNWKCDNCKILEYNEIYLDIFDCFICKNSGGIMKEFIVEDFFEKQWAHMGCIYWLNYNLPKVNKTLNLNYPYKKFIYEDPCSICNLSDGFKIICKTSNCISKFHPECKTRMLILINNINFEIDKDIFYNCFNHNIELIIRSNIRDNKMLCNTFFSFYQKYKDISNKITNKIDFISTDLYDSNFKFTLKKINNKKFKLIPNRNLNENINNLLIELKNKYNNNYSLQDLYKEFSIYDKKFKLLLQ